MSELTDSLNKYRTITIAGQDYKISKITLGIWAEYEDLATAWAMKHQLPLDDPEARATLPLTYMQTTKGRLDLLSLCLQGGGNDISAKQLGEMVPFEKMTEIIDAVTVLITESQPAALPGEDDGRGN